jgi:hypothetical protein
MSRTDDLFAPFGKSLTREPTARNARLHFSAPFHSMMAPAPTRKTVRAFPPMRQQPMNNRIITT